METPTVPILRRSPADDALEPVASPYAGPVPARVWKNLNRRLLKLDRGRYFFPLDSLDAYAFAVEKTASAAARLAMGEIVLEKATPATYLTGVAHKALYRFHLRRVQPARALYRAVQDHVVGRGAHGEDAFDAENFDATQSAPSAKMCHAFGGAGEAGTSAPAGLTIQQLAEALPGIPGAQERRAQATALLEEIYAALDHQLPTTSKPTTTPSAVRAFRAYVAADGDMQRAARLVKMSKTDFYRHWPTWLRLARRIDHAH